MALKKPVLEVVQPPHIQCCVATCEVKATARVFTKSGWVNVCPGHYPTIEPAPRLKSSLLAKEIREEIERRKGHDA